MKENQKAQEIFWVRSAEHLEQRGDDGDWDDAMADAEVSVVRRDASLFSEEELGILLALEDLGQGHLFASWPPAGEDAEGKRRLAKQLARLDETTPGGLVGYVNRAKALLESSKKGENALKGYTPEVPPGSVLNCKSEAFVDLEKVGIGEAGKTAFVLVAGGLGERLGYSGIKLALPSESARAACFLQIYIEHILALQRKAEDGAGTDQGGVSTFVIMTSDDTHDKTRLLLEENDYFGMSPAKIALLKQDKVPCLADNDALLALATNDNYAIQTKPHGHGDVHTLLHGSGLVKEWAAQGK